VKKQQCFGQFVALWLAQPAGPDLYRDRAERWERAQLEAKKRIERRGAWLTAGRRAARAKRLECRGTNYPNDQFG
jgi:hypothetical protein